MEAEQQVSLIIDGREVSVPSGTLILKAAEKLGIEIPIFCYHDKLHPIGACRMCIVDVEGLPKPVPSCSTEVREGMVVHTRTPEVKKMWDSVLEFLLINHPLDCPVCDRGGECPLQDNTFKYGPPDSRFTGEKRHFKKPVPLSPFVLLDRERCIMCTRCVRFCEEISGHEQLKIWDRGHGEYIDTFPGETFSSNFSGNTIELCPVGALLSSVFRFKARPWEIHSTAGVCPHCGVGCNIRVDVRTNRIVVRFLARMNADVDDGWLCDRGRFASDFPNSEQRLEKPLLRRNGELVDVDWSEALDAAAEGLRKAAESSPEQVGAVGSPWRTNEENFLLQKLFRNVLKTNNLDFTFEGRPGGTEAIAEAYNEGLLDGSIRDIMSSDVILAIGSDVSADLPILDLWLKKAVRSGAKMIYAYPEAVELAQPRYAKTHLAYRPGSETQVVEGLTGLLARDIAAKATGLEIEGIDAAAGIMSGAKQVLILLNLRLLGEEHGFVLINALKNARRDLDDTNGPRIRLLPLIPETNAQGAMDAGLLPGFYPGYVKVEDESKAMSGADMLAAAREGKLQALYIMGLDPAADPAHNDDLAKVPFLVVADTFRTKTAELADVVLPSCTFAEKEGTFTNTERRVQRINPAMRLKGLSQPDWVILGQLAERLGTPMTYERPMRIFEEMSEAIPQYRKLDYDLIGEKGAQGTDHDR